MHTELLVPQFAQLIHRWKKNDEIALNQLIALSYNRLHDSARRALGHYSYNASIQTTELVNELYLHFRQQRHIRLNNTEHFFAIATLKLRQILNTRHEKNSAKKRNHGFREDMSAVDGVPSASSFLEAFVVDDHFSFLENIDPLNARIAELKLFWEFDNVEVAEILDISESTVRRKWNTAKAVIANKLQENRVLAA